MIVVKYLRCTIYDGMVVYECNELNQTVTKRKPFDNELTMQQIKKAVDLKNTWPGQVEIWVHPDYYWIGTVSGKFNEPVWALR